VRVAEKKFAKQVGKGFGILCDEFVDRDAVFLGHINGNAFPIRMCMAAFLWQTQRQ